MSRRKKSKSRTLAVVIQDKSGSMSHMTDATISGFNEYVNNLEEDSDSEILLTLVQFDENVSNVYTSIPLSEVPALDKKSYVIGGMTALHDAVGHTVKAVEKTAKPNDKVLVIIMTDGGENSSHTFAKSAILDLFRKKREQGWEFVFLGAGEEAWSAGASLGFDYGKTILYDANVHSHGGVYASLAESTHRFRSAGGQGLTESLSVTKKATEPTYAKASYETLTGGESKESKIPEGEPKIKLWTPEGTAEEV